MTRHFHKFATEHADLFLCATTLELFVHAPPALPRPARPCGSQNGFSNLQLFVTNQCNLTCTYCQITQPRTSALAPDKLGLPDLQAMIAAFLDQAPAQSTIFFTGGEPLLAFEKVLGCLEAVRTHMRGRDCRVFVFTNGTLLDAERLTALASHDAAIIVSMDGPADVQNRCRVHADGVGSYDVVAQNLDLARQLAIPFGISAVLGHHNLSSVAEDARYLIERFAPRGISFNPLHGHDTEPPVLASVPERVAEALYAVQKLAAARGVFVESVSRYLGPIKRRHPRSIECSACGQKVVISGSGALGPCSVIAARGGVRSPCLRSLRRTPLFQKWANRSVSEMPVCRSCTLRHVCGGGCAYDALCWGEGFDYPPPGQCRFVRQLLQLFMNDVAEFAGHLPRGARVEDDIFEELSAAPATAGIFGHSVGHQTA